MALRHGGTIFAHAAAAGIAWQHALDFSASINPLGPSPAAREAMLAAQRYPLEFDGVIAGAPNMHINYAVLGLDWINVEILRARR